MSLKRSRTLIVLLLAVSATVFAVRRYSPVEAQRHTGTDTYAITNAKIVTMSGATIDRGTVVVRDGLIAAVGANTSVPADARTIDGTGLTVYPGVFDANTTLGIPRPSPSPAGGGGGGFQGLFGQSQPSATSPTQVNCPACSLKCSPLI